MHAVLYSIYTDIALIVCILLPETSIHLKLKINSDLTLFYFSYLCDYVYVFFFTWVRSISQEATKTIVR